MTRPIRICVVGGGIVGVSTAVRLLQALSHHRSPIQVTLITDKSTPNTTGDGSAGFWMPYLMPNNPRSKKYQWCLDTFKHIEDLYKKSKEKSFDIGINLLSGYFLLQDCDEKPDLFWSTMVYGFRKMTEQELKLFPMASSGYYFTTYTIECVKYLPYLLQIFTDLGGKIQNRKIANFNQLSNDFDIISNCTGLGSRELTGDTLMTPVRGQVIRVDAPWVKHFITCGDNYILPNSTSVVLGGTHQHDDECLSPYQEDIDFIWEGCQKLQPNLKSARILRHWVGLRPARPEIRIEKQEIASGGRNIPIFHNYGHGGSGVTSHWGCAIDCADLVVQHLTLRSKL